MSGPSTLVLCRTCGWERPYEWFLEVVSDPRGWDEAQRVKVCRACRDGHYHDDDLGEGPIARLARQLEQEA